MFGRLLKSTVVAAIFGVVGTLTWELVALARVAARFRGRTAIGVDFISFARSPILISVCASVFAGTLVYCLWLFRRNRYLPIPMLAAVFGFVLVGSIAALLIASIPHLQQPIPFPITYIIFFFSSAIAVFGFYAGALGGAWLRLRVVHIHSTARLLTEAAIPGTVLGGLFALLVFIMPGVYAPLSATLPTPLQIMPVVICSALGCLISLAFALTFRRRLITSQI